MTKSQEQSILALVKAEITALESMRKTVKEYVGVLYKQADATQPEETAEAFKALNTMKNVGRECDKRIFKMARISKQLKGSIRRLGNAYWHSSDAK